MGSEVWVHLEITNFHFSIGGEHYYGKLVGDVGDEYTHVKLEHALTAKQAAYLNKKDGATCSFGRVRKGDKTGRFDTKDAIRTAAKKVWKSAFPAGVVLIEGSRCSADPHPILVGPADLKQRVNEMCEEAEAFGRWEGDEGKMEMLCKEWGSLMKEATGFSYD